MIFRRNSKNSQSGNVFFAIFGAVALVGILTASVMTFMKGPLSTAVKLTKINTAETQMTIGAQVAVMSTTSQPDNGDCDADTFVEPMEWRAATTEPIPTNGGLIPLSLGISKKDPWGTEYGYCVWNHGTVTTGAGCDANMLTGTNSTAYPVVALISAGPDKAFTTTCLDFATADANTDGDLADVGDSPLVSKAAETDDDIIYSYTYEEATSASGGLWNLKSGDAGTAVISKNIETTGTASLQGGVLLPDSALITCDATTAGVMAQNASGNGIEICDGAGGWTAITGGGGGGASTTFANTTAACDSATAGQVRYNNVTTQPEFCNGTSWTPFALSSPTGSLIVLPASNYSMDITGPCSGGDCPYKYGSWVTFTARNTGLTATPVLSVPTITGANSTNFEIDTGTSTCDNGIALAPSGSSGSACTIVLRAKANGNTSYSAQINVAAGALTATVPLYGVSTGFTCGSGTLGWGGIVVGACTGAGGTEPGTGQFILQEAGCQSSTFEPTCSGNKNSDPQFQWAPTSVYPYEATTSAGNINTVTLLAYAAPAPAAEYCSNLVKNGYSDWFLPSIVELNGFYADTVIRAFFSANNYFSSTYSYDSYAYHYSFSSGADGYDYMNYYKRIRCARKHNTSDPTPLVGDYAQWRTVWGAWHGGIYFGQSSWSGPITYASAPATVTNSPTINFLGFNTTLNISVSGSGSPEFRINGGAWQTSATVTPSAATTSIQLRATSPAIGAETAVTVTVGSGSGTWKLRTYDPTVAKKIFTTSTTYQGNLGGVSGANNICRTRAQFAGLSNYGTYQALISSSGTAGLDNIGWKWGTLVTVNGTVVATSPDSLGTGLVSSPNRDEFGALKTGYVWTGGGYATIPGLGYEQYTWVYASSGATCSSWSSTTSGGDAGTSGSTGSSHIGSGSTSCGASKSIYCVGPNPDLPNITCPGAIDATASKSAAGSYSVTVPGGCAVTFKMWGGGGGKAATYTGGGGGYAYFSETPATSTTYYYTVGGAGSAGYPGGSGSSAAGFGGGSGCRGGAYYASGGGGGATVLYRGSISPANLVVVAAGGGGTTSQNSSGGKAGGDSSNSYSSTVTTGGNGACTVHSSGGGGGGYDGASGGGGSVVNATASSLVGYGGQNWVATGAGITSLTASGAGVNPGNMGDSQRPSGAGCGGYTTCAPLATSAYDGAVVVIY